MPPFNMRSFVWFATVVASIALPACQSAQDATEEELQQRLQGKTVVLLGCPTACQKPTPADRNRICGAEALDRLSTDLGSRPLVIEGRQSGGFGSSTSYYFVDAAGAGTLYYEKSSDVAHCDDCGWYRRSFDRLTMEPVHELSGARASTGRVRLNAGSDVGLFSVDAADCEGIWAR